MSRNKLLFVALCLFLLVTNGYQWLRQMPEEQAKRILLGSAFGLFALLPFGVAGYYIFDIIRRVRAASRKKEPWESEKWRE